MQIGIQPANPICGRPGPLHLTDLTADGGEIVSYDWVSAQQSWQEAYVSMPESPWFPYCFLEQIAGFHGACFRMELVKVKIVVSAKGEATFPVVLELVTVTRSVPNFLHGYPEEFVRRVGVSTKTQNDEHSLWQHDSLKSEEDIQAIWPIPEDLHLAIITNCLPVFRLDPEFETKRFVFDVEIWNLASSSFWREHDLETRGWKHSPYILFESVSSLLLFAIPPALILVHSGAMGDRRDMPF